MTTLDLHDFASERPGDDAILSHLIDALAPLKRWSDRRRRLAALSHLDRHLLQDIGVDPHSYELQD